MRLARSEDSIVMNQPGRSSRVEYQHHQTHTVLTRRQLITSGLTVAIAMSSTELIYGEPVVAGKIRVVVSNTRDYRSGLTLLSSRYKAALVDIGAEWCDYCRVIDQKILPDPDVRRAMEHVALLRVDVTRMDQDSQELLRYLQADGPPTLFLVDTKKGREFAGTRSVGVFHADDLVRRLGPFAPS